MVQAQNGDMVTVHYTGKLEDGTEFDSSVSSTPLQFTLGEDQVIPGFEQAILGMSKGESKTAKILAAEAYGPYMEEHVLTVDRTEFPPNIDPSVGQRLQLRQTDDEVVGVRVTAVSDTSVTLDANHPLAGLDLIFDIELLEIG